MRHLGFPFGFGADGRTSTAAPGAHVRNLVEQVLFTSPGERVNRPDFGSGLFGLVFEPNSDAIGAALRVRVEGSLQQWLSDLILLEAVTVSTDDATLTVVVQYVERLSQERRVETVTRTGGAP